MLHQRITRGDGIPPTVGPYSPGVVAGDVCYVSGQIALDSGTGQFRAGTIQEEADLAMRNLLAVARTAGFAPADFVCVTVLLADMDEFAAFNEVYGAFWSADALPTRMAYQVGRLPLGAKVEIQGVAVRQRS
jgi:2-iminobutanoate/2-iminopropanoate deaminase